MKKVVVLIAVILLAALSISLLLATFLSPSQHPLKKNKYDSIEELHTALVDEMNTERSEDWVTDFYPRDLAYYLNYEDKWFVFCSFSDLPLGEIGKDSLLCYIVYEEDGKFILDSNVWGFGKMAELPLHYDYTHWSYDRYYVEWNNAGESIGFACKNVNEHRSLYYDGVKMEEIELTDPFTNEPFILCYAKSSMTYNVFQRLFINRGQRHSLELN